jgi:predicted permease
MILNYLKLTFRNLIRQPGYSFINIFGLALGLVCTLFIFIWVYDEVSTDRFHENIDRIYRAEMDQVYNGEKYHVNVTPYPAGEGWKNETPEIVEAVRIARTRTHLLERGERAFYENYFSAVDSSFFQVFTFPLKLGDARTALVEPLSMVLSEEMAEKYFGDENPVGQLIEVDKEHQFKVTGVLEKIPVNSSVRLNFIVPFDFLRTIGMYQDSWTSNSIATFVMLAENADPGPVGQKITEIKNKHVAEQRPGSPASETVFSIAPLKRLHLYSYFGFGHNPGRIQQVMIFIIIGIFIVIIAAINYMNLSTARSARRSREIGLRKVAGAKRKQLIGQFLGESVLNVILATLLAVIIVIFLMDQFRLVSGKQIELGFLLSAPFILGALGIIIVTSLLSGFYPSVFLSRFKPIHVIQGDPLERKGKGLLRKILVVVQFAMSLILIIGTATVYKQTKEMQKKDTGYDYKDIMVVNMFGEMPDNYQALKEVISSNPNVDYVSASMALPSMIGSNSGSIDWDGRDPDFRPLVSLSTVDIDYPELLGIEMVNGRSFSREYPADMANQDSASGAFMINETLADLINADDILGIQINFLGIRGPVVGVMKDFHFLSMRTELPPLAVVLTDADNFNFMMIKLRDGADPATASESIESSWKSVMPAYPFEYRYLEEDYDEMYRSETRIAMLLLFFTIAAILIASLGLFGLASFLAEKRTREIGIRKTLGSTNIQIINMMISQFSQLVLIAIVIAIPVSWYFLDTWLDNYAYKTQLSFEVFTIPALAVMIFAIITVLMQAWKASRTSPAVCLKYE